MVKAKQKHLPATSTIKKGARRGRIDSSFANEMDLNGDDGWIIVKKQKVVILIPSMPDAKKFTSPNSRPSQQQTTLGDTCNNQSHVLSEALPMIVTGGELKKSTTLVPKKGIQLARKTPVHKIVPLSKTQVPPVRMGIKSLGQVHASKSRRILGVSHTASIFLDKSNLLNQRLRAANLERMLQRAGGLTRWLTSLGLEQFVRIFRGKRVNKFQLVNLTMNKLKDMGAHAVGPRRKLMHAIDCVCQPTLKIVPGMKTRLAY